MLFSRSDFGYLTGFLRGPGRPKKELRNGLFYPIPCRGQRQNCRHLSGICQEKNAFAECYISQVLSVGEGIELAICHTGLNVGTQEAGQQTERRIHERQ